MLFEEAQRTLFGELRAVGVVARAHVAVESMIGGIGKYLGIRQLNSMPFNGRYRNRCIAFAKMKLYRRA